MNVIKVLAKVEEANQLGRQLPPEAFYNELIRWVGCSEWGEGGWGMGGQHCRLLLEMEGSSMDTKPPLLVSLTAFQCHCGCPESYPCLPAPLPACSEKLDVLDHYVAWRQTHDMPQHGAGTDGPFSFCSYPFLLNPRAKSKLLHTEARIQMDQTVAASRLEQAANNNSLGGGGNGSLSARGGRRPEEDECVVPSEKARISAALRSTAEAAAAAGGSGGHGGRGHAPPGSRRRDRQGGLRWLFNSLRTNDNIAQSGGSSLQVGPCAWRAVVGKHVCRRRPCCCCYCLFSLLASPTHCCTAPCPAAPPSPPPLQDDERRMMGRQINGTSDGTSPSIWKQGSLNLPTPEESGFPAHHPDMCILRIRRNHLLEVGGWAGRGVPLLLVY
jgi:hypothetical protein